MSAVLNALRGFLESFLREDLGLLLCELMEQTTKAVEAEMGQAVQAKEGSDFDPALLCGRTRLRKDRDMKPTNFSGNFSLVDQPYFTATHALIGMKGEILYMVRLGTYPCL